jgi:hypothetical protein
MPLFRSQGRMLAGFLHPFFSLSLPCVDMNAIFLEIKTKPFKLGDALGGPEQFWEGNSIDRDMGGLPLKVKASAGSTHLFD